MAGRSKWDSYLIQKYHDERDASQKAVDALQKAVYALRMENERLIRENTYLRGALAIDPELVFEFDVASGEVLDE